MNERGEKKSGQERMKKNMKRISEWRREHRKA